MSQSRCSLLSDDPGTRSESKFIFSRSSGNFLQMPHTNTTCQAGRTKTTSATATLLLGALLEVDPDLTLPAAYQVDPASCSGPDRRTFRWESTCQQPASLQIPLTLSAVFSCQYSADASPCRAAINRGQKPCLRQAPTKIQLEKCQ